MVDTCKSKGYGTNNHFRKHMFLHNLRVVWDPPRHTKKIIGKSRIQNYKKYNPFALSDEMARKQKELNQQKKKIVQKNNKCLGNLELFKNYS